VRRQPDGQRPAAPQRSVARRSRRVPSRRGDAIRLHNTPPGTDRFFDHVKPTRCPNPVRPLARWRSHMTPFGFRSRAPAAPATRALIFKPVPRIYSMHFQVVCA